MSKFASLIVAASAVVSLASTALADTQSERIKNMIEAMPGDSTVLSVEPSPIEGAYLVETEDSMFYAYAQNQRIMIGSIYNLGRNGANEMQAARMRKLRKVPRSEMIVFGPPNARRYVTVFTDIDCGYCRKFHRDIEVLNRSGLQVRYLMFPRSGINTPSYDKAVSVWCATDQQTAMTLAKANRPISKNRCRNPVASQYRLGNLIGVRGTPTMYLDDGTQIPGYVPPSELLRSVGLVQK